MTKKIEILWLLLLGLNLMGCSKGSPARKAEDAGRREAASAPASPVPTGEAPALQPAATSGHAVKTEMRNVMFHLTDTAAAHLETLSGELWPTGKNEMPVFDDKRSFEVRVASGTVSIAPEALASVMNGYVFAAKDAPVKDVSIAIDKDQLIIKGKLHNKGDIPFGTAGTLSVSSDGRLRMHTDKVSALHLQMKGMMEWFGIEFVNVVNMSKIKGMDTDKNDLLMDLGTLLPPPHIRGKVTAVRLEKNALVVIYGDGGKSFPATTEAGSYMAFQGNRLRFGKLTMEDADLTLLDLDPGDPLDWDQDHYKEQLVAGYTKITEKFGLRVYVKDYAKLPRASSALASTG